MPVLTEATLISTAEAASLIEAGHRLWIAGDESCLAALPAGEWVGATIPYFMTESGGTSSTDRVHVTVLPDAVKSVSIRLFDAEELSALATHYPTHGFAFLLLPAFTEAHRVFAQDCSNWPGVFDRPLIGWIAGSAVEMIGAVRPRVFHGPTAESSPEKAVAMFVTLHDDTIPHANIINLFQPGDGDVITFPDNSFEATECFVNGEPRPVVDYLRSIDFDHKLPLVADYMGAHVNVSVRAIDATIGSVSFYAPVFPGVEYRVAKPVTDYPAQFAVALKDHREHPLFTCNCILNYIYADLEGKKTADWTGPITFGEIAYMLLNQTLVYLTLEPRS